MALSVDLEALIMKKVLVDLITAIFLIITGCVVLALPIMGVNNVKVLFIVVLALYGIINLVQFILTIKDKDYEGLFTAIASVVTIIIAAFTDLKTVPLNLAMTLFVWISFMSLIKLKKIDYYHDRKRKIWLLRMITLVLFILSGLLSVINLYYESEVQILILGFFFFIHGILELVDPITNYLLEKK